MIARVWRGETLAERADEYHRYLLETGAAECTTLAGNTGVQVWRRENAGVAEFIFVSHWRSMEDIRAFAGDDLDRAVYYPKDHEFLLALDAHVRHYDLTEVSAPNTTAATGAGHAR